MTDFGLKSSDVIESNSLFSQLIKEKKFISSGNDISFILKIECINLIYIVNLKYNF